MMAACTNQQPPAVLPHHYGGAFISHRWTIDSLKPHESGNPGPPHIIKADYKSEIVLSSSMLAVCWVNLSAPFLALRFSLACISPVSRKISRIFPNMLLNWSMGTSRSRSSRLTYCSLFAAPLRELFWTDLYRTILQDTGGFCHD
jgi:hypothetical protein